MASYLRVQVKALTMPISFCMICSPAPKPSDLFLLTSSIPVQCLPCCPQTQQAGSSPRILCLFLLLPDSSHIWSAASRSQLKCHLIRKASLEYPVLYSISLPTHFLIPPSPLIFFNAIALINLYCTVYICLVMFICLLEIRL